MPLESRPESGGDWYNPQRDWAYCHRQMVRCIKDAFNKDRWPVVLQLVAQGMHRWSWAPDEEQELLDAAWAELDKANIAFCKFCNICAGGEHSDIETFAQHAQESGFLDVHPAAQWGWLAMLGQVMMGQMWLGLRDITGLGKGPRPEVADLLNAGLEGRRILNNLTKGDDLQTDLGILVRMLRNNDVGWEAIDRILAREKNLERPSG